jgi:PAS domain S-box-containing protein
VTESPYSELFDASPFPAVVSRLHDHIVLAVNARAAEIIGIPQRAALGLSVTDYYADREERIQLAERLRRDGHADNLRLRIKRQNGEPFWVLASFRLVVWKGEPAVLGVFHDISEQLAAETSLKTSERRLGAQSDALTRLTARYTNPSEHFDERLRSILEISARALAVERLSMWQFADERSSIRCMGLYRHTGDQYESGSALHRDDAPAYFEALERDRTIAANDARTDARTCEFLDAYLIRTALAPCSTCRCGTTTGQSACSAPSMSAARERGPSMSRISRWLSPTSSWSRLRRKNGEAPSRVSRRAKPERV